MNLGVISSITWKEEYETATDTQGFKTIKPRAGNKPVSFKISSRFMRHFKQYLKLRSYLLEALDCPEYSHLFFSIADGKPKQLGMDFSLGYNTRLKRLFGIETKVTTRQWRALMADWLIRHTDMATTAQVLQNSTETVAKHYSEGSSNAASEELTEYFDQYGDQLIVHSKTDVSAVTAGSCADIGNPKPLMEENSGISNCTQAEGCIVCRHYRVHADIDDIRKLYSFVYVLSVSRVLLKDDNHFNSLMGAVFKRLQIIVDILKESSLIPNEMINQVYEEVFKSEKLTPYWGRKLDLLTELEVV